MSSAIDDATMAELRELAGRYPQARSALLPMLHLVQSVDNRVSNEGIEACAEVLGITSAEVSAVATFYTMYKRRPMGKHHVGVCTNTLCAIMGGDEIFDRLSDHLDVGNDETSDDGQITIERVECNAACDFAPVVMVNWEFFDTMTPESTLEMVDRLRADEPVTSTRGARITSWREAERVLAGYPDGRADEGPTAGPASLVGLEIARERGWHAPGLDDPEHSYVADEPSGEHVGHDASAEESAAKADTQRAESETKSTADEGETPPPGLQEMKGREFDDAASESGPKREEH